MKCEKCRRFRPLHEYLDRKTERVVNVRLCQRCRRKRKTSNSERVASIDKLLT